MKSAVATIAFIFLILACSHSDAAPTVAHTEVIGPFTGHDAPMHPENLEPEPLRYYGTDLGFTYEHDGEIRFLFGDSWAIESYAPIEAASGSRFDDMIGSISLADWPDSAKISPANIPPIKLNRYPGTNEVAAIDPGHAMDLGKTPMHGFSNGEHEYGIFNLTKPRGCTADEQCGHGQTCDIALGYLGTRFDQEENLTLPCPDGTPACVAETMVDAEGERVPESGFCLDQGSTIWADSPAGRVAATALNVRIGVRSKEEPRKYVNTVDWLTNRFVNVTARPVQHFVPSGKGGKPETDYRSARGAGKSQRVLLWGRPQFIGVNATGRTLGLYFAYVDLPDSEHFEWDVQYFTGLKEGVPQFSPDQGDAAPLDLDSTQDGIQFQDPFDLSQQMSVSWVIPLQKWVMFYGGGIISLPTAALPNCGVLELFTRYECQQVVVGNGAVRMRTADNPWGPWSPAVEVLASGDPNVPNSGQYGPGGMLHHPDCAGEGCATHTQTTAYSPREYGFLYSANIIEQWTRKVDGGVDIYWNASTWDPYRVALFRTRITP